MSLEKSLERETGFEPATVSTGSNPMDQPWSFAYSLLDVHSAPSSDDISGTLRILSMLQLLPTDRAPALQREAGTPKGPRYLDITGQLSIPFKDSPLFEHGQPRSRASFIRTYRANLASYIEASQESLHGSPEFTYRTKVLEDDQLWAGLLSIGNPMAFGQLLPGISDFQAQVIGSEYYFVLDSSSPLANVAQAAFSASRSIAQGDVNSYSRALTELLTALRPLRKSEHYF